MSEPEAASSSAEILAGPPPEDAKPFEEPEAKRRKVSGPEGEKHKLEERLGGILCCAVCLDLPKAAVYQVSPMRTLRNRSIDRT